MTVKTRTEITASVDFPMTLSFRAAAFSMVTAIVLASCAKPTSAPPDRVNKAETVATCGVLPTLVMDPAQDWPVALREGGKELRQLRANFAAGFAEACAKGIIPASGPVDREGHPFNRIDVMHNPDANQLLIARGAAGPSGPMFMQEIFWTQDGAIHIPKPVDFVYEFTCMMKPPSDEERERTGDCMYD